MVSPSPPRDCARIMLNVQERNLRKQIVEEQVKLKEAEQKKHLKKREATSQQVVEERENKNQTTEGKHPGLLAWILAGAGGGGILGLFLILLVIVFCGNQKHTTKRVTSPKSSAYEEVSEIVATSYENENPNVLLAKGCTSRDSKGQDSLYMALQYPDQSIYGQLESLPVKT